MKSQYNLNPLGGYGEAPGTLDAFHAHRMAPVDTPQMRAQLSTIPEGVANEPFPGVELPAQNATTDLMELRARFPFLPILPFPTRTVSLALTANTSASIRVPDGAKLGLIQGSADYYVSRHGNAEIPSSSNANPSGDIGDVFAHSLYRPEFAFLYLGGITELSFIAPTTGTIVQVAFWNTQNWARR